jgi:hypothetical protein
MLAAALGDLEEQKLMDEHRYIHISALGSGHAVVQGTEPYKQPVIPGCI